MCRCGWLAALWEHIRILMRLLVAVPVLQVIPFSVSLQERSLTLYSMVWDWRVLRAGSVGLSCSLRRSLSAAVFHFSSLFLSAGVVCWGRRTDGVWVCWGRRTDGVWVALSQPCVATLFGNNNNYDNNNTNVCSIVWAYGATFHFGVEWNLCVFLLLLSVVFLDHSILALLMKTITSRVLLS